MTTSQEYASLRIHQFRGQDKWAIGPDLAHRVCDAYGRDNARRIVACWNACQGLSTDALEQMPAPFAQMLDQNFMSLWARYTSAKAQRDELLEVLKTFEITGPDADGLVWLVLHGNGTTGKAMFNLGSSDKLATQVALMLEQDRRAALAKATGGEVGIPTSEQNQQVAAPRKSQPGNWWRPLYSDANGRKG